MYIAVSSITEFILLLKITIIIIILFSEFVQWNTSTFLLDNPPLSLTIRTLPSQKISLRLHQCQTTFTFTVSIFTFTFSVKPLTITSTIITITISVKPVTITPTSFSSCWIFYNLAPSCESVWHLTDMPTSAYVKNLKMFHHHDKGPFIYYVIHFGGLDRPPPPYVIL